MSKLNQGGATWLAIAAAMGAFDNLPRRSPKERDKRTEADIAERVEKQRAKLARRAKRVTR